MATYSHSKLETFEKCKLKFKYRYIDKIIPEIQKTIEAQLGTCVHAALEWLYNQVLEGKTPQITEVIEYYSENWLGSYSPEVVIVNKNMEVGDYFSKGVEFLLSYYKKHQPFKDNTIATEKKIEINLDEKGERKIIGFVDRIVYDIEKNEIEIHDYKTSGSAFLKDPNENDRQLALYSLAAKELFGKDKEVCMIWHFLAHDKEVCLRRTNEQLEKTKQDAIKLIDEIENTKNFPANPSRLCDWCEYKNICPAIKGQKQLGI